MGTAHWTSFVQIEITTICNFDCFYCAGRNMPQRHMDRQTFDAILESLPSGNCTVSLQGEGEPVLHPRFIAMAKQVVKAGKTPYTITNCSRLDPIVIDELFPQIGVSLDTPDPVEAQRSGRHDIRKVIANLDHLLARMGPSRVILHTVNYGQPLEQLRRFAHERGLVERHIIQPLQVKKDYRERYPGHPISDESIYHFRCRYLQQPLMRYFDVMGLEMPCCFIKDASKFVSMKHTCQAMSQRKLPECCAGCNEIMVGSQ